MKMINIPQIVCVFMLGIIVKGQITPTYEPIQEVYCPQSCNCTMTDRGRIFCDLTNDLTFNFTEEMTMATESNQSLDYDIHIICSGDADIVWTSSDFLRKTVQFRMFNCNIINDGPILFPPYTRTENFELDSIRPSAVDKFRFRGLTVMTRFQISNSNLNRIPNLPLMLSSSKRTLEFNNFIDGPFKRMCKVEVRFKSPSFHCHFLSLLGFPRGVDLSYNQISNLNNFTNSYIYNFTLSHNSIKEIKQSSFPVIIKYLDLSYNQIETIEIAAFSNLKYLKDLFLNGNNLIVFDSRHISFKPFNNQVDLRSNQLKYPPFEYNRSTVKSSYLKVKASHNPYICNCRTKELMAQQSVQQMFTDKDWMKCQEPARLQNKSELSLNLTDSCPIVMKCPVSCTCDYNKSSDITSIVCINKTLSTLPRDLPKGRLSLNFTFNMIDKLDTRDYFNRIVQLDLGYNQISTINRFALIRLSSIQTLNLTHNNITSLPRDIIHIPFSPSTQVYLSYNPWLCSCKLLWFAAWLRDNSSPITDKDQLQCNFLPINVIDVTYDSLQCYVRLKSHMFYLITILLLLIFLKYLIIKCRFNAKVLLHTRLGIQYFAPPVVSETLKENDVFIVYDDEEITWIKNVLLKRLEDIEKPYYKTILRDRDFLPGVDEAENVNDAISNSYCTLFIFSNNFLQNELCLYTFHSAYKQMLKEKDIKIVIILKDKIEVDNLNDDLKAYFRQHTYLEVNDKIFWDKLVHALPRNSQHIPQKPILNCE